MTHAIDRNSGAVSLSDTDERARAAVKVFRTLQPTLSAYARILTRRTDVRVEMSGTDNGSTDGKRIFFRPPIELGDKRPHTRKLCDKRDSEMQLLCDACRIREQVLVTIYHEIAHICYNSFENVSEYDKVQATKDAISEYGTKYAKRIEAAVAARGSYSYQGIAGVVSPYLPLIVNALEDARIENKLFEARKGVRVMFHASNWQTFRDGVEGVDRESGQITNQKWIDAPLNAQATVGLYLKAAGYEYAAWLHQDVVTALDDVVVTTYCRKIGTVRSVANVYQLAFPLMARLRQYGFFKPEHEPEDEPEPEPLNQPEPEKQEEKDEGSSSGDDSQESESGDDSGEGEPGDSDDADSDSDNQQPGTSGEGGGDQSSAKSEGDSDESDPQDSSGESEPSDNESGELDEAETQGSSTPGDSDSDGNGSPGDKPVRGNLDKQEGEAGNDANSGDPAPLGGEVDESAERRDESSADDAGMGSGSASSTEGGERNLDPTERRDTDLDANDSLDDERSSDDVQDSIGQPLDEVGNSDSGVSDEERNETSSVPLGVPSGESDGTEASTSVGYEEVRAPQDDESEDLIDTGADTGRGGTEVDKNLPSPELGDHEQAKAMLVKWLDHEDLPKSVEIKEAENAVAKAIIQGMYFETPSMHIGGVEEHRYGVASRKTRPNAWTKHSHAGFGQRAIGKIGEYDTPEALLGPALLKMRVTFADNQRGSNERNLKSGKVSTRVLGKRAYAGDPRLFRKHNMPGKKNYFVCIMLDVSGSTVGVNIDIEKHAVMAQAHLLDRLGIPFAIYAESGSSQAGESFLSGNFDLDIYVVKEEHQPWDAKAQEALATLGPDANNLDGHALEYARKALDRSDATDKIILYYSDGKMPAANHDEELDILQREIRTIRNKRYTLLGVGIRTDSPTRHGLETVQLDSISDIGKVIDQLKKHLLKKQG